MTSASLPATLKPERACCWLYVLVALFKPAYNNVATVPQVGVGVYCSSTLTLTFSFRMKLANLLVSF